jgi:hypothetical protein
MAQSKKGSMTETLVNTAIGYSINFAANMLILPLFGFHVTVAGNLLMGVFYTGISIVRSYVIRRVFNQLNIFQV